MGAININDMRSRIRGLETDEMIVQERVLNNIKTHYSSKQIFSFMEECITRSSSPNLLTCMEIFDIFAEKSNVSMTLAVPSLFMVFLLLLFVVFCIT